MVDVGCGSGGSAYDLSEAHGVHVHGLDLSVNCLLAALERASNRSGDVTFEVADVANHSLPAASFDAVHCRDSLLHTTDKATALRNFNTWMKPGGRLVITDYFVSSLPVSGLSKGMQDYIEHRKYDLKTMEEFGQAVQAAGFEGVEIKDLTEEVRLGVL